MSLNQQKAEQDGPLTQQVHMDVPNCVLGYPVVTQSHTTTTTNAASAGHTHTQESKNNVKIAVAVKIVACILGFIALSTLIFNTVPPSFSLNKASISLIEDMKSNETITAEWNLDFTVENSNVIATINFEKIEVQVACLSKVSKPNETVIEAGKSKLHAPLGQRSMNATVTMVFNRSDIPEDLRGFQLKFEVIFQSVISSWGRYKDTSVCKDTTVRFASKSGPGIFVDTQHFCLSVQDFDPMTSTFTPVF